MKPNMEGHTCNHSILTQEVEAVRSRVQDHPQLQPRKLRLCLKYIINQSIQMTQWVKPVNLTSVWFQVEGEKASSCKPANCPLTPHKCHGLWAPLYANEPQEWDRDLHSLS